jgi:hypothetical protein
MNCEYTTQGMYLCKKKEEEKSKCNDNTLKYMAADTNYDMNIKSMLYQLRVTNEGYRAYNAATQNNNNK